MQTSATEPARHFHYERDASYTRGISQILTNAAHQHSDSGIYFTDGIRRNRHLFSRIPLYWKKPDSYWAVCRLAARKRAATSSCCSSTREISFALSGHAPSADWCRVH